LIAKCINKKETKVSLSKRRKIAGLGDKNTLEEVSDEVNMENGKYILKLLMNSVYIGKKITELRIYAHENCLNNFIFILYIIMFHNNS